MTLITGYKLVSKPTLLYAKLSAFSAGAANCIPSGHFSFATLSISFKRLS